MKRLVLIIAALVLVSCSESVTPAADSAPEAASSSETTVAPKKETPTETSVTTETKPAKTVSYKQIEVEVKDISNDMLSFTFEGADYEVRINEDQVEKHAYGQYEETLCEKVIHNPYGITVLAKLTVDEDMTHISKFDPYSLNGRLIEGYGTLIGNPGLDMTKSYSFKRTGGSACELSNGEETVKCDLNDLPMVFKLDYPDECEIRAFGAFEFTDGACILDDLSMFVFDEPSKWETYNKNNGFYATVESVSDGKAAVLLNDGKTRCTVPTYYNDGEVTEGAKVMVVLDEDTSLFGSGTDKEYSFAVIYTDPEVFHHSAFEFEEVAWARRNIKNSFDSFAYTYLKDIEGGTGG